MQSAYRQPLIYSAANPAPCPVGLTKGTPVLTLQGQIPVEYLSVGERIVTRQSGSAILRDLRSFQLVDQAFRVSGAWPGRPAGSPDVVLPAHQLIYLRTPETRELCGSDQLLAKAEDLADGCMIESLGRIEMTLFCLRFDSSHVIYAGGLELPVPTAAR